MQVAVLGAERDGRAVAELCALAGHEVRFHADDATAVMDSIDVIERRFDDAVGTGKLDDGAREDALDRLEGTTGLEAALSGAEVAVETLVDDAGRLQERFADIEAFAGRETLVTATTPVTVTAAAAGLRHPDRALGLRFHRPLERALVEVVVADQTSRAARTRAESFADGLGVPSVVVGDEPGGIATRLGLALEVEAMRMVADDLAGVEAVDEALRRGYGHPVGPLERADRAGLADRLETLESLADAFGSRFRPPALLADLVDAGTTGMDAGEGFYRWEDGEPAGAALSPPALAREKGPQDPAGGAGQSS